jgi:hypothetical protein
MKKKFFNKMNVITSCNDHIGGIVGEIVLKYFLKQRLIEAHDDDVFLTDKGKEELELMGIEQSLLCSPTSVQICHEQDFGIVYEHLGGTLGRLFLHRLLELGWVLPRDEGSYVFTQKGLEGFTTLGIDLKKFHPTYCQQYTCMEQKGTAYDGQSE